MEQGLETAQPPVVATPETPDPPGAESVIDEHPLVWLEDTGREIVHATRSWLQYGALGFAVLCIVIGAVEALLGR